MIRPVGFSRAELESFAGTTVPDLIGPGLRLLFVGINPGLWTAATQTHFAHPGNRFYPALLLGGVIDRPIDRGTGFTDDDRDYLVRRGIGITNLAKRATAKASELTADELRRGGEELRALVRERSPAVVAAPASPRSARRSARPRSSSASKTADSKVPDCGSCPTRAGSMPMPWSRPLPPPTASRRSPPASSADRDDRRQCRCVRTTAPSRS
jgi:double-stranded uracil-DNA glycosylase